MKTNVSNISKESFAEKLQEYKNTGKKVLYLPIKQIYFDQILSGEKTQEFREVTPNNVARYIQLDEEGYEREDEQHNAIPREFDALHIAVGYNKDRDEMLIELKDSYSEIFVDENDEPIVYEYQGRNFVAEQVVYNLGKILYCHHKK